MSLLKTCLYITLALCLMLLHTCYAGTSLQLHTVCPSIHRYCKEVNLGYLDYTRYVSTCYIIPFNDWRDGKLNGIQVQSFGKSLKSNNFKESYSYILSFEMYCTTALLFLEPYNCSYKVMWNNLLPMTTIGCIQYSWVQTL